MLTPSNDYSQCMDGDLSLQGVGIPLRALRRLGELASHQRGGPEVPARLIGVRWALIATEFLNVIAFVLFWRAAKTIREETVS